MTLNKGTNLKLSLLILRAQTGDHRAFTELYALFKLSSFQYIRSLSSVSVDVVDDINQQVWLKVYQKISKLNSPFGFTKWLMVITRREVLAYLRKNKGEVIADDFEALDLRESYERESYEQAFLAETDLRDFNWLTEKIYQLPFEHKEVLLLHYWQELSCLDIAEIVQVPEGTVKSRLFKARKSLASTLKRERCKHTLLEKVN